MIWLVQVFMIALIGTTIMLFGNKFLSSIASVNLNGSNVDDIEGTVSGKLTQGAGLAMGLAAGGIGASVAGGSVLKGAAMGGMSGARGGKPATSALLGLAAGRVAGSREQEKKRKEREQAEHNAKMEIDPVYRAQYEQRQEQAEQAQKKREDAVMLESTADDAGRWVQWAKEDWDPEKGEKGKVVGRPTQRLVPEPTDEELKALLEEEGIEFRPRLDQMQDEVSRVTETGMSDAVESPQVVDSLGESIRAAMDESFRDPSRNLANIWKPEGSPLWSPGQDPAAAPASLILPDGSVLQPGTSSPSGPAVSAPPAADESTIPRPEVAVPTVVLPGQVTADGATTVVTGANSGAEVESAIAMASAAQEVRNAAQDLGDQARRGPVRPTMGGAGDGNIAGLQNVVQDLERSVANLGQPGASALGRHVAEGQSIVADLKQALAEGGRGNAQETARLVAEASSRMQQWSHGTSDPALQQVSAQLERIVRGLS